METETRSTLLDDLEKSFEYDEEDDKPTYEEVAKACKDMKNGKSPGSDGIASETWKDKALQPMLLKMVQYVWEKDEFPNEWNLSLINAIPKKKGFRTVSIINSAAKVYAKELNNRVKETVKEFVGKKQYGFISKRSTKQAILRIDIKREHFTEHRKKVNW